MSGEEAGMGESGVGEGLSGSVDATCLQWFFFLSFFFTFSFILFLSIYILLSLSHHNKGEKKKKKTCVHARLNFFVFS